MLIAKRGFFLTAISLGSLLLLLTSCSPPGDTEGRMDELRADVDALKAEVQQLSSEVATLKGEPSQTRSAKEPAKSFEPTSLNVGNSAFLGSESAPVTMFSYNDYTCAECVSYATEVLPEILSKYVESGSLRIVMREFPDRQAGRNALKMARIAVCAGRQGMYLEMHDWLYTAERTGKEDLVAHVQELNLDQEEFRSCVRDETIASQIRADVTEARESAIRSAPGFLLGLTNPDNPERVEVTRQLVGSSQAAEIQAAIDELLMQAGASN